MTADSSGVVDLEALMKEHPTWLDDALSRAKGATTQGPERAALPGTSSPALAGPALLAPPSLAPTAFDDVPVGVPRNNRALIAASVGALLLVGAASVFAFRSPAKEAAPPAPVAAAAIAPVAPSDTHAEDPIPPPPASDVAAAAAPQAAAAAPAAKDDDTTASADATEPEAPPRHGRHGGHSVHRAALHTAEAAQSTPAPAPAPKPVKGGSALDAALRNAMGPAGAIPAVPGGNAPAPAAAAPAAPAAASNRPDTPSPSAVKSALTGAMSAAHGCLSGSEPSHARITFGSSGNVQSVDITGPAASDRKAVSCVKSAFNRAHVPPFSQSSYSAGVTIRPQ